MVPVHGGGAIFSLEKLNMYCIHIYSMWITKQKKS
uniref:Uncharacterized protein n=1 Tax=Aegilops tauschii subsp. strangulata TaxID=200361 RepID=A0A453FFR3_AEGTS